MSASLDSAMRSGSPQVRPPDPGASEARAVNPADRGGLSHGGRGCAEPPLPERPASPSPAPLRIGTLAVDSPVALAPMAGFTDAALRVLCREQGASFAMTEVVTAEGLVRGSRLSRDMLEVMPGERPVGAHIYGSSPATMTRAAALIAEMGQHDFLDINCGCPVRKIVAKGAGAALIRDPFRVHQIVKAVRAVVPFPVTVKTRTAYSATEGSGLDVARAVEDAGGAAVFVHARPATRVHAGPVDLEALARIKAALKIPVFGNGGICGPDEARTMLQSTGVDGVLVGRAAIGNPWLFAVLRAMLENRPAPPEPTLDERRAMIYRHLELLTEVLAKERRHKRSVVRTAEEAAVLQFRGHLVKYMHGLRDWIDLRRGLDTMRTRADLVSRVEAVLARQ